MCRLAMILGEVTFSVPLISFFSPSVKKKKLLFSPSTFRKKYSFLQKFAKNILSFQSSQVFRICFLFSPPASCNNFFFLFSPPRICKTQSVVSVPLGQLPLNLPVQVINRQPYLKFTFKLQPYLYRWHTYTRTFILNLNMIHFLGERRKKVSPISM